MMRKKKYIMILIAGCLFAFAFITGCGKYATQYSAPTIISRSPAIGATAVPSNEVLWIKFSKAMDVSNLDISQFSSKIKPATDMNAVTTVDATLTPEAVWTEDNTKLVVTNIFFISTESSARVHLIASIEAFIDRNGLFLPENIDLWNYTLQ